MTKVLYTTIAVFFAIIIMAQKTDLSGSWKLKDKKGLSGTLYSNAVPQQIKVTQTKDTLILETTEEKLFPADIVGTEKNSLDGKPLEATLGKKKIKRTATVKFDKEGKTCTRICSIYQEDGIAIYATYTDTYSLEGNNFILQRKGENFTNGEVWECWSVYEKGK